MPTAALSILSLLQYAPQAISEITALYNAIKGTFSTHDQQTIDGALAAAQSGDAQSTKNADDALTAAASR